MEWSAYLAGNISNEGFEKYNNTWEGESENYKISLLVKVQKYSTVQQFIMGSESMINFGIR